MEENNEENKLNAKKDTLKESVAQKELSELLCCSNDDRSKINFEQLSEKEVAQLWLRINNNL